MKNIRTLGATLAVLLLMTTPLLAEIGEVLQSFNTPGSCPTGLTFDGNYLWLADRKTDLIYQIDITNGKVCHKIPSPGYWPMGLAFDGKYLWNVDWEEKKIYKLSTKEGTIIQAIDSPTPSPRGLTWDGTYLWLSDDKTGQISQISADDGTTIISHKSPAGKPYGMTFDGKYLWVSNRFTDELYMVTPEDGYVIMILKAPGKYAHGLAWDGQTLWNVDYQNDQLYQLKVDGEKTFTLSNERHSRVELAHQFRNHGPGLVKQLDVYIAVPSKLNNLQIVGKVSYNPSPVDFVKDKWNQRYAHFRYENVEPNKFANSTMCIEAKIHEIRYFLRPEKVGLLDEIPKDIRETYLVDGSKYRINDPFIKASAKDAIGDETNPYWIARKIYQWLMGKMYYELSGGWNIAPTVLERGNGSCSEYSFVYIALCRAGGLPARYAGSVVVRGDDACYDDVFHRWVEVYLPNYGWVPVDPSGGDQDSPRAQANYFGHLSNRYLITTINGGDSKYLGWTYNFSEAYVAEPKCKIHIEHIAEWEPVE